MAEMKFSLLEVDLTKGTSQVLDVTEDTKKYLGARGLANKLRWDLVPQGADPYGPENILHFGIGPVAGVIGTKTFISFMSPLTNWPGRSAASGYFGEEMLKAHYNAGILVKGKASKPVYIYVWDDQVEIRDASDLWGALKQKTEVTLRDRLNEETGEIFGIMAIGPAGENLVRYANAATEFVHSASKWGCGGVMGSKNLKAVCVRGTKGRPYDDHEAVWELMKNYAQSPITALRRTGESRYGHTTSMPHLLREAAEGVKNNHGGYDPICEETNLYRHEMQYMAWSDSCPGCAAGCFVPYLKRSDRGIFGGEFRHDNWGGFNANVMMGYEQAPEVTAWLDELGMDGEELGGLVAWAMDLYENGIITLDDLGGIDLRWGDVDATLKFMKAVAYRDGKAADAIADGFRRAYEVFGEESIWYAMEVHGCAAPTYDVRNKRSGRGLDFGTSHTGARRTNNPSGMLGEAVGQCNFAQSPWGSLHGSTVEAYRVVMNACWGWNLTPEDMDDHALRTYYFNRALSFREGYHPDKDDYLPPRAYDEPIYNKYGVEYVWASKEEFDEARKEYYVKTLKLTDRGVLPRAELERLGLGFVIPVLEPLDALG